MSLLKPRVVLFSKGFAWRQHRMERIDCGCHFIFQRPALPRQQWQVEVALQSSKDAPQLAHILWQWASSAQRASWGAQLLNFSQKLTSCSIDKKYSHSPELYKLTMSLTWISQSCSSGIAGLKKREKNPSPPKKKSLAAALLKMYFGSSLGKGMWLPLQPPRDPVLVGSAVMLDEVCIALNLLQTPCWVRARWEPGLRYRVGGHIFISMQEGMESSFFSLKLMALTSNALQPSFS